MDLSWSELLVVGIVALIIIGPKDLPGMFRELGRFTAKVRAMGREFSRAMEQAAKDSGVKDVADDLRKVTSPKAMGLDAVKSAADKFEKWDPLKNAAKPTKPLTPAPMPATPVPAAETPVGPATAALYENQAARKSAAKEASARTSAIPEPATGPLEVKKPGRRRKKPEASGGEDA
jgi:sec-independent protein translocase protein TatB